MRTSHYAPNVVIHVGGFAEAIGAISGFATVIIAVMALRTWKLESRAKAEIAYWDQLTNSVHEFADAISHAIMLVRFIRFGFEAHTTDKSSEQNRLNGALAYAAKYGSENAKELSESLEKCAPLVANIRTLKAKGSMFSIPNYNRCGHSIRLLLWNYDRIALFKILLTDQNLNRENKRVRELYLEILKINDEELSRSVTKDRDELLEFAKSRYKHLLT